MPQIQDVFKRYEKKYMLNSLQHDALMQSLEKHMTIDQYGMHTIGNIYYDTNNFDLIRSSIEKPIYKEKLRLRSYGIPKEEDIVFIEIKKKFKGIVYKRRIQLTLKEAEHYLLQGEQPSFSSQILHEIDWFLDTYHPVPKVLIAYDRCALFGKEDENLRITFDKNIRFRESNLNLSKGTWGYPLLDREKTLMEIKIPGAIPLWLSKLLTEHKIFPSSFSKYGSCYQKYLFKQTHSKGGITCA
jgi:SPX domain protein involved in polyphosphate accumulation